MSALPGGMKKFIIPLALFVVALLPRLPGLGRFVITDEHTNIFIAGSQVLEAFLAGDLRATYWHFYPGVTMSWLTDLGLGVQYLLATTTGATRQPITEYIFGEMNTLLVAARLPFVLLTALSVPVIYLLARRLVSPSVALPAALFIAFDPFYLAHSRVNHGDAPVAVFMVVSLLSLLIYVQSPARFLAGPRFWAVIANPWVILSAVFGGLAGLTKAPGQFMALFLIGLAGLFILLDVWRKQQPFIRAALNWLVVVAVWGGVSFLVFVLLWPSMWVDPVGTLTQMLTETFGKVEAGHLVYFRGQATLNPGPWFYPYITAFRLTPVILIGVLLSLPLLVPAVARRTTIFTVTEEKDAAGQANDRGLTLLLLWLFVISLWLFGNLSPKKQDRYLLPVYPVLSLIAAIGWSGVLSLTLEQLGRPTRWLQAFVVTGLVLLHAIPVVTYYPYYLTYFNPLLGGPQQAVKTTLIGWGEGMEQVGAYLNSRPNAANLHVAAVPVQTLLPYFEGSGENFYTNDIPFRADYVVIYISQMQRLAPSPEIVNYFEDRQPEKVITIKNIPYAKIYKSRPVIGTEVPPEAVAVNIGLEDKMRLAGYQLYPGEASLTLYWHLLTPLTEDYTISVRAYDRQGRLLAQQDQWPIGGLLPTSRLRQGDYVADTHHLPELTPAAEAEQIERFEVVVYNVGTGATVGQPLTIPDTNE
jgi:4-amino-4-deoxy-L-arabinose transferase-like glycosyltransferase